jgi:hypothetical protein
MKLEGLRKKLIRAARQDPPSDHVPYAFEQRVLHSLRNLPAPDPFLPWVSGLWRAAACTTALTLVVGTLHWRNAPGSFATLELPQDRDLLELAVLGDLELVANDSSLPW